ncbi:hypothetical protein BDV38DRAFT_235883 [Aspergillus pseudotamarii]|uniref:Uncharacterized protein n=1 Tax=Aspergillus pseudotamarii TaxID=132259 RepID=A0A5N6T796_ASPPS|nr:uncharacterized protein BDV38DRAFT_235883 [Aspergillus pseudotamarii]KAE8142116.1 hypothetical protein BDV38DRAFT_235883 [Aspergillus pseudotamarii]
MGMYVCMYYESIYLVPGSGLADMETIFFFSLYIDNPGTISFAIYSISFYFIQM